MPLVVEVAAGLIRDERGRYLITQRRQGSHLAGKWEFPGGKLEAGETAAACVSRRCSTMGWTSSSRRSGGNIRIAR